MSRSTSKEVIELSDDEPMERAAPVPLAAATTASRRSSCETPLIPSDCASAFEGTLNFQTVFEARYGRYGQGDDGFLMPPFFIGTLQDAIKEAFECPDRPVSERRSLALYIHHDGSVARNIFPSSVLCNDAVLSLLRSQFIVWPWDVTAKENAEKLTKWVNEASLDDVRAHIADFIIKKNKVDRFPLLVLLSKKGSQLRMVADVTGSESPEQTMEKLIKCLDETSWVAATTCDDTPLIPKNCVSALEGTLSFSSVFEQRYCANGGLAPPPFFIGSLQEALKEAFDKPAVAERRPLALYIHQDGNIANGDFPKKLCVGETAALLRSNFVMWPWDVTEQENQVKLMTWLIECSLHNVNSGVSNALARSNNNGFTMMLLLTKNGQELKVEEQIGEDEADKIFDTLTKVMKEYADVKPRVASRKRSHPADE